MDGDISCWILEYVLESSMKDRVLKKIFAALPILDQHHRLRKKVLLRTLQSDLLKAEVSETMLDIFEMIEELDKSEGIAVMESMKAAYCAVAVECTVKFLVGDIDNGIEYLDAVKRIWRGRVTTMKRLGNCELVSPQLKGRNEEMEAALWDMNVRNKLTNMNTRNEALILIGAYLRETRKISPPFLELSATLINNKEKNEVLPSQLESKGGKQVATVTMNNEEDGELVTGTLDHEEVQGSVENLTTDKVSEEAVLNELNPSLSGSDKPVAKDARHEEVQELVPITTGRIEVQGSVNQMTDKVREEVTLKNPNANLGSCGEPAEEDVGNIEVDELAPKISDHTEVQRSVENGMTYEVSKEAVLNDPNPSLGGSNKHAAKDAENLNVCVLPRHKLLASHKRTRGGSKINDPLELDKTTSSDRYGSLLTPDVNVVQEALKISALDLHAMVKDPLPDALRVSESVVFNLAEKNTEHEHSPQHQNGEDADNSASEKGDEDLQSRNAAPEDPCSSNRKVCTRHSLMEQNSTACIYEWEDSIDGSPDRVRLLSPKRKAVSPLRRQEPTRFTRRRAFRKWSVMEEDALRSGVEKFGRGHWKLILNCYRDVFEDRTEVDLKDKWRNMSRYY